MRTSTTRTTTAVALTAFLACGSTGACGLYKPAFVARHQIALLDAERAYTMQLAEGLRRLAAKPDLRSMSAVVSEHTIDRLLHGLAEVRIDVPQIDGNVTIRTVDATFRDGFPEVRLDARVETSRVPVVLNVRIGATLEPRVSGGASDTLAIAVRPLEIHPSVEAGGTAIAAPDALDPILAAVLGRCIEALPTFTMPLGWQLAVDFPATTHNIRVPTQSGALNGVIETPAFSTKLAVTITQLYFLTDGLHVAASIDPGAPKLLPFDLPEVSRLSADNYDRAVKEREQALAKARQALEPFAAPLKILDADLAVTLAPESIDAVFAAFNALPEGSRTIHYRTASEEGQLFRTGSGGAGCGGYAALDRADSAQADLKICALNTQFGGGALTASGRFSFSFRVQVRGHVHGAPTPTVRWVQDCAVCPPRPQPGTTCDTQVGGGVGVGSMGLKGNREETVVVRLTVRSDEAACLRYDLSLDSPKTIPITIEAGLGSLGTVGLPFTFGLPQSTLASGTAPPLFGDRGRLELEQPVLVTKEYDLKIAPKSFLLSQTGYQVKSAVAITWRKAM